MEVFYSIKPLAAVLVPVLAVILILFSGRRPNIRESWTIMAAVAMFGIIFSMLPDVLDSRYPGISLLNISPGISLAFRVDTVGIIFALSASLLWIVTSFYSIGYMRTLAEKKQTRYYASFALCLSIFICCFCQRLTPQLQFLHKLSSSLQHFSPLNGQIVC